MIHEKLVFNEHGNLLANCAVNILADGMVTDFSPVTSNSVGAVIFDAPEGDYEVVKYEPVEVVEAVVSKRASILNDE